MGYSFKEIYASVPMEKRKQDGLWTRFVLRPLSIPPAALALRLKLSANTVSYISVLFSIGGGILFSMDGFWFPLWGGILLNIFSILDCVDGNVARMTGAANPWGGWADAVMGFIAYTAVFLATGVYAYLRSFWWPVLLVTALTSSANLLTRVAYQIYKNIEGGAAHGSVSFERILAENVGITGFLMPALLVCHFLGGVVIGGMYIETMYIIIGFNALFYGAGCTVTIFKLAGKARKAGAAGQGASS